MPARLRSLTDWKIALVFTAGLRLLYSALAAVFSIVLHPDPARIQTNQLTDALPPAGALHNALFDVWARFDALWYLHIAQHGYDRPMSVIFYPLYPMAIRVFGFGSPSIVSALLVSTVAAFFFFWGILRLAHDDLSERGRSRMLLLLCAWPTSFVLFAAYAESLMLALVVWAISFARRERWWWACACGVLAGIARPSGVLVCIPLFILALRSRKSAAWPALLSPVGLLGYWGWLRWTGHASVIEAYRSQQGMTLVAPWTGLWEATRLMTHEVDVVLAIKLGLVILMLVLSLRREVRIEDRLFSLAIILQMLMYTGRPLLGGTRYLLAVYPGFVALGSVAESWSSRRLGFYVVCLATLNLAWMKAFMNWSLVL